MENKDKQHVSICVCGHVDAGKSKKKSSIFPLDKTNVL